MLVFMKAKVRTVFVVIKDLVAFTFAFYLRAVLVSVLFMSFVDSQLADEVKKETVRVKVFL